MTPEVRAQKLFTVPDVAEKTGAPELGSLFENAHDSILILEPGTENVLEVNQRACELYGYTREEFQKLSMKNLCVFDFGNPIRMIFSAKEQAFEFETIQRRKDGRIIHLEVHSSHIPWGNQTVIISINRDVTDRKRAESELRESEARYRLIFENNPEPTMVYDLETLKILTINEAAIKTYGYSKAEFLGMTIKDLRPPEEIPGLMARLNLTDDQIRESGPWKHQRKNGELFWVSVALHSIKIGNRPSRLVLIRDVTRELQIEKELQAAHRNLEARVEERTRELLEESKKIRNSALRELEFKKSIDSLEEERELRERFVYTLTHDLRNPLTAARSVAELLLRPAISLESRDRFAAKVIENLDRADRMIRDLLDANRIRAGQSLPLNIENCNLGTLARDIVDNFSVSLGGRLLLRGEADVLGYWSEDGLRRLIENLLSNAIKYGDKHSPILVEIKSAHPRVEIRVHNQGNPISPAELHDLFKPFRRARSALGSGQRGWGLGLTLVKGVAEAHGGFVEVESSVEGGTTFIVSIPRDSRAFQNLL